MIGSMSEPLEHYRAAVIGMPVSHVWRGHGSALFIELGALAPRTRRDGSAGEPQGEAGVMIEWSWRIEDGPSITCGSWSDEDLWSLTFARLIGSIVEDVSTIGRLPQVMVRLSGDLHVASFMTAEGDPAWTLFDRRGPRPVAMSCRAGVIGLGL